MKDHEDLRIVKTKKALQKTLIDLLSQKSFEEIKVAEICNKSFINRTTFYSHYKDKYELFNDTIKNLKKDLTENLKQNSKIHSSIDYIMKLLDIFLIHIEDNKNIYMPIINHNKNGIIMDMVENTLEKDLISQLSNDYDIINLKIPIKIIVKFYIGAIFSTGMEWLSNSSKYTKEDLQNNIKFLIENGISHK